MWREVVGIGLCIRYIRLLLFARIIIEFYAYIVAGAFWPCLAKRPQVLCSWASSCLIKYMAASAMVPR